LGCNHLNSATKTITLRKQYFDINHVPNAMKNRIVLVILCWGIQLVNFAQSKMDPSTYLWYATPAKKWEEAIPVGNGRLGAMIFGKYGEERIQLNESTYWSWGPYSTVVKNGYKSLSTIQKLVFDGKYLEAHNLFGRKLNGLSSRTTKISESRQFNFIFSGTR
jgi:alpha-L-fucosidase 2